MAFLRWMVFGSDATVLIQMECTHSTFISALLHQSATFSDEMETALAYPRKGFTPMVST